ncbi:uncharacterized protein DEA37_0009434 [Paragonimus westermani]|uniref:Ig-like domain-containing protein n=1 Tax=Paragonimus westermani TaxID=34504 RepID=A0A5J4NBJ5_9TREM|nr:uncharacterized protein DEA37_0009434 [Paragonimus westermani]
MRPIFITDNFRCLYIKVILPCPVTGPQIIHSWLWHKPILPISEDFAKIQPDKPSRLLVTARTEGNHGLVEIGPKLNWARIVDPLSPEAPTKLWCQFEVPSEWENKDPVVAYFTINWELYEPISPKVYLLDSNSGNRTSEGNSEIQFTEPLPFHGNQENQPLRETPQTLARVYDPAVLTQQFQEAQRNENNQLPLAVLEHKPARFGCQFRKVDKNGPAQTDAQKWPTQQVFWYRDNIPVHVPPFQVFNELVASHGIALLEIRAYPALFQQNSPKGEYRTKSSPIERITCVVTSQVKDKPVYKVTTNAR